jgi:hypothetical protein
MTNESWHLSKSVPLSIIGGIMFQTFVFGYWISSIESSIQSNADKIARHEVAIATMQSSVHEQAIILARLDENVKAIKDHMMK